MKHGKALSMLIIVLCVMPISIASCSKGGSKTNDSTVISSGDKSLNVENDASATPSVTGTGKKGEDEIMMDTNTKDGKLQWSFKTDGGIVSTPVIKGDTIYFGSKDGNIYAVDKESGGEIWRYSLGKPILCQPAIAGDSVFFSGGEVYAGVNALTGEELWKYDYQSGTIVSTRKDQWDYHDSSPVIDNGVVYFGSGTGAVLGFDSDTGKIVWELNAPGSSAVRTTPLIQNGVIYYGDWAGNYRAVDIATKKLLWENSYKQALQSAAAIDNGIIFIGGRDVCIHAIDCKTGASKWNYSDPEGSWITGDPVVAGDTLYISTSDAKKVYAMNILDGKIKAEYPIYKNSFSKVAIENDFLYVTSGDAYSEPGSGKLQVFQLNDTKECSWEIDLSTGGIFSSPLVADGKVYFGSEDKCLYAYRLNQNGTNQTAD